MLTPALNTSSEPFIVLVILVISIILFVTEKMRVDLVAILVLLALLLTGVVPEQDILSGFSNAATMTIVAMFILSAGLQRTGIVRWIANQLHALVGRGQQRMNTVLMAVCGFFSAFTSNTATVAVLLPVSMSLAKKRNINPSRVLMPLSFAAQFGGVCTLIGTTTNLLVSAIAVEAGYPALSMFEFAKLGLVCFVVGMVYMLFASRFLMKDRISADGVTEEYRLQDYLTEMRVLEGSSLIGQTGGENGLTEIGEVTVLEIIRDGKPIWAPQSTEIQQDDILLIRGDVTLVMESEGRLKLEDWAEGNLSETHLRSDDVTLMEVMIPTGSHIIGRSINQLDFYWRYHAAVLGVRRRGSPLQERMANVAFKNGDTLLLQGHKSDLEHLADEQDFVLLQDLSPLKLKKRRALLALMIMMAVLVTASLGMLSVLSAALLGAVAMVITRCIRPDEVYESIDMKVIVLLAGLIPLGLAMQNSGLAEICVDYLVTEVGSYGPFALLCLLYAITMVLTAVMSNAATAVLLAPIALAIADGFAVDPKPFLMAVTFAASTCFSTPVGYQTNVMIYGPGGYKYIDFLKIGVPLNLIFFVISVTLIPYIWPF